MSSSEQERARELAERIARRLADSQARDDARGRAGESGGGGADFAALRASLSEIQRRLAHIESHLKHDEGCEHEGAPAGATRRWRFDDEEGASKERAGSSRTTPARSMWLSGTYVPASSHPSQEHFSNVGEAVSELVEFFEGEKTCSVEPGGKPCDHCGMCSSRGF